MKTKLTKEFLIKQNNPTREIIIFSCVTAAGLVCFLCPLAYCKDIKNLIMNMAVMLIMAVPFCGIGIKNIVSAVKTYNYIKKGEYIITEDFVTVKRFTLRGASDDTSDNKCHLNFKYYSKKTGKTIIVSRKIYNETKEGDKFYIIYVRDKLNAYYPESKFELP